jgi:hypothetical protein
MPKVNTAKRKMLAGEAAYGYALGMASPLAAEALADSGVDWILLDNQHGSFGPDSTIACLMAMAAGSAIPMARVARNDYTMIGRMLDEGALGIVVPMVHTPELAKQAADACRFPPVGTRSYGWGRAARYGDDYVDWINDELFLAIQLMASGPGRPTSRSRWASTRAAWPTTTATRARWRRSSRPAATPARSPASPAAPRRRPRCAPARASSSSPPVATWAS